MTKAAAVMVCGGEKKLFLRFLKILIFGEEAICPDGLFVPAVFREVRFYLNSLRYTLALRGLEEPFFQLCCCVSFWFRREIGFGCTYYYVLGVPYSCGVVLVCLLSVWWVRDHYYDRKKRYSRLSGGCAIIITTGKKKIQSSVWRVRDHVCLSCRDRYICISST